MDVLTALSGFQHGLAPYWQELADIRFAFHGHQDIQDNDINSGIK